MVDKENSQQIVEIMKNTIKDVVNILWEDSNVDEIENFSEFLADGVMETIEIRPLVSSESGDRLLVEISLIPVEEVWEITEEA